MSSLPRGHAPGPAVEQVQAGMAAEVSRRGHSRADDNGSQVNEVAEVCTLQALEAIPWRMVQAQAGRDH